MGASCGLGFQEACLGAPWLFPIPPDAACCSGYGRLPVSVTLSSARENSTLAPSRRGPHPMTSHPPFPSWQLISSPHSVCGRVLNAPRLITEPLIPALPQRGRRGRLEVSVYSTLHRLMLITNRQGRGFPSLLHPPLPPPTSLLLFSFPSVPLFRCI